MRRRRLLALLSGVTVGTPGCSMVGDDPEITETVTPVEVPSVTRTRPAAEDEPTADSRTDRRPRSWGVDGPADVVTFATGPRRVSVAPTTYRTSGLVVALRFGGRATADRPARLQALLYNDSETERSVSLEWVPPLSSPVPRASAESPVRERPVGIPTTVEPERTRTTGLPVGLWLLPTPGHELLDGVERVERGPEGYWHAPENIGLFDQPEAVTLGPEGSVRGEYWVVGPAGTPGLHPGVYRFDDLTDGPAMIDADQVPTVVVWNTDRSGPAVDSRFDDRLAPAFRRHRVDWFHHATRTATRYLQPGRERVALPATLPLRLVDRRTDWASGRLTLYKRVDGEWYHVGPRPGVHLGGGYGSLPEVGRDGTVRYQVAMAHDRPRSSFGQSVGYLGGGRYAFVVVPPRTNDRWTGALLDVEAPPVTPWIDEDATIERTGETVVVTGPEVDGPEDGEVVAQAVATRAPDADGRRLLPEQVMGRWGYGPAVRNTLPLFEDGVEKVRYLSGDPLRTLSLRDLLDEAVTLQGPTVRLSLADGRGERTPD